MSIRGNTYFEMGEMRRLGKLHEPCREQPTGPMLTSRIRVPRAIIRVALGPTKL